MNRPSVQRQAGIKNGDRLEFSVSSGTITIAPANVARQCPVLGVGEKHAVRILFAFTKGITLRSSLVAQCHERVNAAGPLRGNKTRQ